MVTLIAQTRCWLCGYLYEVVRVSPVRVNKLSLKETGLSFVMIGARGAIGFPSPPGRWCPECGEPSEYSSISVPRYRLGPGDEAAVEAYRDRRWPGGEG